MHGANNLTKQILIGMLLGLTIGATLHFLLNPPEPTTANNIFTHTIFQFFNWLAHSTPHAVTHFINEYIVNGLFDIVGQLFIKSLKLLVVPVVFISLVCGTCALDNSSSLGRLSIKAIGLYIITTGLAITLAITLSSLAIMVFQPDAIDASSATNFTAKAIPSLKDTIINIIPSNPIKALAEGNMLQIILFAILFGIAITKSGDIGKKVSQTFINLNEVIMRFITMMMYIAPYGVFCLMITLITSKGIGVFDQLIIYFLTVIIALLLHAFGVFSLLLVFLAKLNPLIFFKKMRNAILFAFSTASSNATIPVTLRAVEKRLGVKNAIASFTVPLGATINMDGTAIMQGAATVFIAYFYQIDISLTGYLTVILTAMLASIGTAGVPGVGLITLAMVLQQVGLPVEGIALIIGVDRLLDMVRTAVNVTGDATVSCIVAKSEHQFESDVFNDPKAGKV